MIDPEYEKQLEAALAEIEAERLRSQRFIQGTYATFALLALGAAILSRFFYGSIGVSAVEGGSVGRSFLVLATANLVVLGIWERFWRR